MHASLGLPAVFLLATDVEAQTLQPTPACGHGDDVTPSQTEGPYFKPKSPRRTSLLEPSINGNKILLQGYVRTTQCKPVARALVDLWHADAAGVYDNAGYRCRGHQFTDEAGRYYFETVVPGLYPGRTRHFHVKVQAPNRPILTTQLYFPGESQNKSDGIFNRKLLLSMRDASGGQLGTFDFVLNL
ncbi:MAG: intradiol ring-cleavage dioxygenase [Candidatus Binatia bacterium]